jgi:hypothetical protein
VLCNAPTPFRRDDPIEMRTDYVEGCGQLCHPCAAMIHQPHPPHTKESFYENEI